jgi:hypothetical protein
MTPKTLLLDIDGVFIRNELLLNQVSYNSSRYVHTHAPIQNLSFSQSKSLNTMLYKNYGHTLRGLRTTFQSNAMEYSNSSFSDFVYDEDVITNLKKYIKTNSEFKNICQELQSLLLLCKINNIGVYIYSNAPLSWCEPIVHEFDTYNLILKKNIFSSDHYLFENYYLKPDPILYTLIERYIQIQHNHDTKALLSIQHFFVDDSQINLLPIITNNKWAPLLFQTKTHNDDACFHQISSFTDLKMYLSEFVKKH